jgi:cell division septum initiation protein DivIVA
VKGKITMSNIETSLENIERIIAEAKTMPFSTKLLIDEEELSRLVEDIRLNMPVEITQAKKIAQERRDILNDAESQAGEIIEKARQRADIMIEQHQITKEAKAAADDMLQQARDEAAAVRAEAKNNARDIMARAEKWSDDIRRSASVYVETIIKDTDEVLTKSVTDVRRLRQSVRETLAKTEGAAKPNLD